MAHAVHGDAAATLRKACGKIACLFNAMRRDELRVELSFGIFFRYKNADGGQLDHGVADAAEVAFHAALPTTAHDDEIATAILGAAKDQFGRGGALQQAHIGFVGDMIGEPREFKFDFASAVEHGLGCRDIGFRGRQDLDH